MLNNIIFLGFYFKFDDIIDLNEVRSSPRFKTKLVVLHVFFIDV